MDKEALEAYFLEVKKDFPVVSDSSLVYFDNAATTQKPNSVISRVHHWYSKENANVHRGLYTLSEEATSQFEAVRDQVKTFLDAEHREEIVFTSGTTDALNLIAFGYVHLLEEGDEILLTEVEHHANLIPWQEIASRYGLILRFLPFDVSYRFPEQISQYLTQRTKIFAFPHVSNVLGTILPIARYSEVARAHGVLSIIDGAQGIGHLPVSMREVDCDFYVGSAHKLYGPTGTGVLYGKYEHLCQLKPLRYGGEMIYEVGWHNSTYLDPPHGLEAGTPNIAGVLGLGEAIRYVEDTGRESIERYEKELSSYFLQRFSEVPECTLYGPHQSEERLPVFSFSVDGIHPHDVSAILNHDHIAVRAGHHCAMPLMERLGVMATVRASLTFYNTRSEIDSFISSLKTLKERHARGESLQ